MNTDSENLRALETLLNEFFAPTTSNKRKQEIERLLEQFRQQARAWKDCLFFLLHTSDNYVYMFSLTTLESVIHVAWAGMLGEERAEIRTTLNNFLLQHHRSAPAFIKNKLVKLIVDIARSDWPHFYPDFMPQVRKLIGQQDTLLLGLSMMLTTSEELGSPREDISTSRAVELRRLMEGQVGDMLVAVATQLDKILDIDLGGTVTTPPPSPSLSGDSEDSNSMDGLLGNPTTIISGTLLQSASTRALANVGKTRSLSLDEESRTIASHCLKCIAHIFTWASLSRALTPRLLNTIFQFAALEARTGNDAALHGQGNSEISTLAMLAINEIMYKNFVPTDFQGYLVIMFKNTFQLLQGLLQDSGGKVLQRIDEMYMEKICEFLRLFVCVHLGRCEVQQQQFPVLEFLGLLFKLTFQQPSVQGFYSCLDIWGCVIDYIQSSIDMNREDGLAKLLKYQEALLSLVVELLKKLQLRQNAEQLNHLDNVTTNDDNETEWQHFLRVGIETIMKVADLLPSEVIGLVEPGWRHVSVMYLSLDKLLTETDGKRSLHVREREDVVTLHQTLRDYSSYLQLFGRLSSLFLGESFKERLEMGLDLLKQLLALVTFGSTQRLWRCDVQLEEITTDLMEAHSQTVAALKAWCHWLAALHSESLTDSTYTWICSDITDRIVVAVVSLVKEGDHVSLVHSAAHFMVTLTGTVRPPSIWKLKEFTDLYSSVQHINLQPQAYRLIVRSLCNVLLLHWPGILEQKWEDRRKHLTKFLKDRTQTFRSLKTTPGFTENKVLQKQAEGEIVHTLEMLGDLVENVLNEVTQTKKLCHDAIRDYIELSLWLFPLYINSTRVCEHLFNFFHTVFDVLKTQMGSVFVEQAIQTFLSHFGQGQLSDVINQRNGAGSRVIEKFLSILTFIVSEPGTSFRKLIPSTLSLCLDHIYPLVSTTPSDIKSPLYHLLYNSLLHNWQYFFKSSLVHRSAGDEVQHPDTFLAVLKAIGQSFLQEDIAVFRQNIEALEHLNAKWRLYHKPIFVHNLLVDFLTVLLEVLIARSHNLLKDEICVAVYNMAAVDFPAFTAKFLPHFLTSQAQLDDNQRHILANAFRADTDLPSFGSNLDRFVTDVRFYRLLNASLSAATVKF